MRVRDPHAEGGTIAEVVDDCFGSVVQVDRDVADPVACQQRDQMLQEGPPRQRKHRLWPIPGQGSQPGALPGRQDERVDWLRRGSAAVGCRRRSRSRTGRPGAGPAGRRHSQSEARPRAAAHESVR